MTAPKRLARPRPAQVQTSDDGVPVAVGSVAVDTVLEDWVVEDRWWTDRPLRRRYLELALENGRCALVFRDLIGGRWFTQRG
jgi:hypothetical protein